MKKNVLLSLFIVLVVLAVTGCAEETPETIKIKDEVINTNLTSLDLSNRQLKDSEIKQLKHMKKLTELDLSNNQIDSISVLKGLTTLVRLNLAGNPIIQGSKLGELQGALPTCAITMR